MQTINYRLRCRLVIPLIDLHSLSQFRNPPYYSHSLFEVTIFQRFWYIRLHTISNAIRPLRSIISISWLPFLSVHQFGEVKNCPILVVFWSGQPYTWVSFTISLANLHERVHIHIQKEVRSNDLDDETIACRVILSLAYLFWRLYNRHRLPKRSGSLTADKSQLQHKSSQWGVKEQTLENPRTCWSN